MIANHEITTIAKGDKFCLEQCPKGKLEIQEMQKIPYASAVGSLMYAQVCTRSDIAYIVGVLGRYLSNPGMDHWKAAKRDMRYLQRTKCHMLTYRRSDNMGILTLIFRDAKIVESLLWVMFFCWPVGRSHGVLLSNHS